MRSDIGNSKNGYQVRKIIRNLLKSMLTVIVN